MDSSSSSLVLHSSFQYTDFSFHLLKGRILDQRWEVDTQLFSPKMVLRFLILSMDGIHKALKLLQLDASAAGQPLLRLGTGCDPIQRLCETCWGMVQQE